jgi:RES domain-containing protein
MILFRISRCKYIDDLSGTGTRINGARWCSPGRPGVFLPSSRALAMLEVLVHLQPLFLPDDFCLAEIEIPENGIIRADLTLLPSDWRNMSAPAQLKNIGDDFLREQKYLALKLPSAIVTAEYNFLINPLHPDMKKVKIRHRENFNFDQRLIRH